MFAMTFIIPFLSMFCPKQIKMSCERADGDSGCESVAGAAPSVPSPAHRLLVLSCPSYMVGRQLHSIREKPSARCAQLCCQGLSFPSTRRPWAGEWHPAHPVYLGPDDVVK